MANRANQVLAVDEAVSRAKFARETASLLASREANLRRGWWVVKAEFPEVMVVMGTPHLRPPLAAYGVLLDCTGYDLFPPSVRFVDPFTCEPLTMAQLRQVASMVGGGPPIGFILPIWQQSPDGNGPFQLPQDLVQAHGEDEIPFICMRGTREYHAHPAHSNDPWLPLRGTGTGTIYHLLDTISRLGTEQIQAIGYNLQVQAAYIRKEPQP